MTSQIDPSKPVDGVPSVKSDLRANLQSAKDEIEALQSGKTDLGHQHVLADVVNAGALAGRNLVQLGDLASAVVTTSVLADAAVVEAKLADGAVTQAKIAANAVGASQLQAGIAIDMQDQQLTRPQLKDISETSTTPAASLGALTLDLETGNVFEVTLDQDVTSLTLANAPASGRAGSITLVLKQDATGGRTVAWPSSIRWPGGTLPIATNTPNAVDVYAFITRDAGATWYGFPAGKAFS